MGETTTTKAADTKYLADLVATCSQKASDFESRQQLRTEELEAIAKAIEILSSSAVSGNAEKYLPTLVQKGGMSLGQFRSGEQTAVQRRVAEFLREQGRQLN